MQKKRYIQMVTVIVLMAFLFAGCGSGKGSPKETETKPGGIPAINVQENQAIQQLIKEYFTKMYSAPVETYVNASYTGSVPAVIKPFISTATLALGEGNPEIPIHYPRPLQVNGQVVNQYELLPKAEKSKEADIQSDFVQKQEDAYLYLVKVNLKAKSVSGDEIRLQARYSVYAVKEEKDFKISKCLEASRMSSQKNRVTLLNNSFVTKLPYLNLQMKKDGETFEKESAVLQSFFEQLQKLDGESMKLLNSVWEKGNAADFDAYLGKLGLNKNKDGKKLLTVDEKYKTNFDILSFPIQSNMAKVGGIGGFTVSQHPAYSARIKRYFVAFEAAVENKNIVTEQKTNYHFDYTVDMVEDAGNPVVSGFYLNEFYKI